MVGSAVAGAGVGAVGVGFCGVGEQGELRGAWTSGGVVSAWCVHPCLFSLPPCPLLALDDVLSRSGVEAAVDTEAGRDAGSAVDFVASPPAAGCCQESFCTESTRHVGEVVDAHAECACQNISGLGVVGGACVDVAGEQAECWGSEGVVSCCCGAGGEGFQEEGSLGGAGPCGARVRL